jgi:hypothetical protein
MTERDKREIARELRQKGLSYRQIVKELKVSISTASLWCRDIELTDEQERALYEGKKMWGDDNKGAQHNRETALQERIVYQQAGREAARKERFLHIIGCMLYWAEGGKYNRGRVDFANSDPAMLGLFVRFLREELHVADSAIKIKVHCHTTDETKIRNMEQYWLDLFQLPLSSLKKTQSKEGSPNRVNRLTNGVCSIVVDSTEILMHILGAIQEYGGFTREEWLS